MSTPGTTTADAGRPRAFVSIVGGGLAAGVLDILDAMIVWWFRTGATPTRILQSVASGLLGRDAYAGGLLTAALGTGLHFFIALTAAAVYFLASLRLPILVRRAVTCGLAYGVAVYFFMNHVVLPLSAFPQGRGGFSSFLFLDGVVGHALLVGLPIALCVRRSSASPDHSRGGRVTRE